MRMRLTLKSALGLMGLVSISTMVALSGCKAAEADQDGDGIPDSEDPDVDGDGIPNNMDPDFVAPAGGTGGSGDGGVDGSLDGGLNLDGGMNGTGGNGVAPECTTDENGMEVCVCIKIATWGALGTFGAVPGMDGQDAIGAWLNENSTGDAEYFAAKPPITAESLAAYNVIIIQDVSAWAAFTADEKAAFEAWIKGGGGVITLNGYSANGNEMINVNDLLGFTGISYVASSDTSNEAVREALLGDCDYCYGSSVPQAGWETHPLTENMKKVGAFYGRSITPGTATVVATEGENVVGAAAQLESGRVFVFHDEWVTYNSQWTGDGLPKDCRDSTLHPMVCALEHPLEQYSLPQFWFNSLKWLSGDKACFDITDPTIVK